MLWMLAGLGASLTCYARPPMLLLMPSVHARLHTCIHTRKSKRATHTHAFPSTNTCTHTHTFTHAHIHTYTQTCSQTRMHVHSHTHKHNTIWPHCSPPSGTRLFPITHPHRRETVEKLVRAFGYPPNLFDLEFDYNFMMRGLIVDKKRGNIIKVCVVG